MVKYDPAFYVIGTLCIGYEETSFIWFAFISWRVSRLYQSFDSVGRPACTHLWAYPPVAYLLSYNL